MWPFKRKSLPVDLPEALKEQARQNPGGWVYDIDAAIGDPMGEVPNFAIKGARKVDDKGKITGAFEPNAKYDHEKTLEWIAARDQEKD